MKIKQIDISPLKILFVSYAPFKYSVSFTVNLSKNKNTNTASMLKKNVVEAYRSYPGFCILRFGNNLSKYFIFSKNPGFG